MACRAVARSEAVRPASWNRIDAWLRNVSGLQQRPNRPNRHEFLPDAAAQFD